MVLILNDSKIIFPKNVLTFTDRWSRDLPVFQLVVDANHQNVIPRNPTEGWTRVLVPVAPVAHGYLGPRGSSTVTL